MLDKQPISKDHKLHSYITVLSDAVREGGQRTGGGMRRWDAGRWLGL